MRVSRIWRDLMARIGSGLGHDTKTELQPGGLAIFCPACPQPGINLSEDWKNDERRCVSLHFLKIKFSWLSGGCIPEA
jgi:hypothetical protein